MQDTIYNRDDRCKCEWCSTVIAVRDTITQLHGDSTVYCPSCESWSRLDIMEES